MKYISIFALVALSTEALLINSTAPANTTAAAKPLVWLPPFYPWDNGVGGYERKVPPQFESDAGDKLMHSIIINYAIETRDTDGKPSGKFYLDMNGAYALAREVIKTHLGFSGDKLEKFFNENVPQAWARHDVNNEGKIEAMKGPAFCRLVVGNLEAGFGLQLK